LCTTRFDTAAGSNMPLAMDTVNATNPVIELYPPSESPVLPQPAR
jgi:hypothetical protein